jgi:D-alanyl-D-alanine carboxypeptidase
MEQSPIADGNPLRAGVAYADRWLEYRRESRDLPGLVAAVQHHGEPLLSKGYGFACLESATAMTPRHVFRIASHSKTFTATAIMQLVEQGRLRLDDRASAYLPWLASDVTPRQLLNHAAGVIRDGHDADFWQVQAPFPDRDRLRAIAEGGTIFDPNHTFKYSNIGYGLLGLVIEAVTGGSYNEYVTARIVDRLQLPDTGPEVHAGLTDRLVTGYTTSRFGVPRRAVPLEVDTQALSPATGFYSTAEDLCRYAAAHLPGDTTLLSDASKREMQQPYWSVEQADEHYGLGFSVRQIGKRRMVGHGGGFPGQSTRTLFDPADGLIVVVLSNSTGLGGQAAPVAETIVKIVDFALEKASAPEVAVAPERFTGRFVNLGGVIDVAAFGNALVLLGPEADNPVERVTDVEVVDADTLRITGGGGYGAPGEPVRYIRDAAGSTERIVVGGVSSYPVEAFRARYASRD